MKKMKTRTIKFLILAILAGVLGACDDILDIDPKTSYTEKTIFSDPALTEAYLTKHYALLKPGWGADWIRADQYSLRFVSDEAMCNFNWQGYWSINNGEMTPDQIGGLDIWTSYYSNIKDINIFFQNLEALESLDETSKNTLTGEAHFFRAFYYMNLVNFYGGVPLVLKPLNLDDPDLMVGRNTYQECADFVVSEFQKAADLLPESQTGGDFGRATKGAALAFKSRMLLYMASPLWNTSNDMSKWQAASDAAKAVIDMSYQLDSNYGGLFLNPNSPEIIFQRLYTSEFGTYFDWSNTPNGWGGYSATCVLQDMVDSYEMEDGTMPDESMYATATSDPWLNRDPRFYASIVCDAHPFRGHTAEFWEDENGTSGGHSSRFGNGGWNASKTSYTIRKFMNEKLRNVWSDKSSQPWVFCRLAEIYLNYAEAQYHLGNGSIARDYLNKIRNRARNGKIDILPDVTATGADLLKKIQHERKVELAFEDHRFFDVRRWKIAEQTENKPGRGIRVIKKSDGTKSYNIITVQPDRKFIAPNHYLLPIPRYEIEKNDLLKQNPGYKQ